MRRKPPHIKHKMDWVGIGKGRLGNKPINPLAIRPLKDRTLSWNQLKRKYPRMNPYGDIDNDLYFNKNDCRPLDPTRDGVFQAIAGAVGGLFRKGKGTVSSGWKTGMAKGKPERTERRLTRGELKSMKGQGVVPYYKEKKKKLRYNKDIPTLTEKEITRLERMGVSPTKIAALSQSRRSSRNRDLASKAGFKQLVKEQDIGAKKILSPTQKVLRKVYRAIPGLSESISPTKLKEKTRTVPTQWKRVAIYGTSPSGRRIIVEHKKVPTKWKQITEKVHVPVGYSERIEDARRKIQMGKIDPVTARKTAAFKKGMRMIYPIIPKGATSGTYEYQSKSGTRPGRGRPKGSVKYSIPGVGPVGVYRYRRWAAKQKRDAKEAMKMQLEQLRAQQTGQELPQEMQGQGVTAEYSQFEEQQPQQYQQQYQPQQVQPQVQQYQRPQPQMPQEPQERAVVTPFKSSGGKPYPAVDTRPLAPSTQTIQYGYVEAVDAFTGRRYMKKVPQAERWARPK